jgi:exonuclease SbcD
MPCRYSGSPLAYSFSESDQQKEVVLVEAYPGADVLITPIKLTSGRPMKSLRFNSYDEACRWCEEPANLESWVDMKIQVPEPLQGSQISALRKLHPGIISIQVLLPGLDVSAAGERRLSELSLEEKFTRFVAGETGAAPSKELFALFLELLEGGDDLETD